uniref:nitric-oxide synthase (NADPH) n=1 Tax=Timema cristinae TaxID=61476 RepID=A0A7R9CCP2_TIMCR|nr:unnamed protein product [Timema cristinae]
MYTPFTLNGISLTLTYYTVTYLKGLSIVEPWYKFAHSLEAMKSNQVVIDASEDKLEYVAYTISDLLPLLPHALNIPPHSFPDFIYNPVLLGGMNNSSPAFTGNTPLHTTGLPSQAVCSTYSPLGMSSSRQKADVLSTEFGCQRVATLPRLTTLGMGKLHPKYGPPRLEKTSSIIELISEMDEAVNYRNKAENEQLNGELVTEETTPGDNVSIDNVSNENHDNESNEVAITDSEVQNSVSGEEASCGADYAGLCSGEDKDSPVPREHDVTTPTDEVSPQKHGTDELKGVVKNSQAAKKNSFSNLPSYIVDSLTDVQEEGETEENKLNGRLFEMGTNEATLLDETMNTTNRISESEDHTVSSILSIISEVKDAGSVKRQLKHINAIKSCIMENVAQMTGKPLQHIRARHRKGGQPVTWIEHDTEKETACYLNRARDRKGGQPVTWIEHETARGATCYLNRSLGRKGGQPVTWIEHDAEKGTSQEIECDILTVNSYDGDILWTHFCQYKNALYEINSVSQSRLDTDTVGCCGLLMHDILQCQMRRTSKKFLGVLYSSTEYSLRYSVFALGSSVYPNFCAFGHYMDHLLARLGGKRLLKVAEGDEMKGQRRAFRKWVADVFPKNEVYKMVSFVPTPVSTRIMVSVPSGIPVA